MTSWNELFNDEKNIKRFPETEIYKFVTTLEQLFSERPLRLWDICCGAGRHTVAMASFGHKIYASDNAPNAITLTRKYLSERGLQAELMLSDMTICPWPEASFHGVISWDALHHNTLGNIQRAIDEIHKHLIPGGFFMGTFKSSKSDSYGRGKEIESDTFISYDGKEKGIMHHHFNEVGIRNLFQNWEVIALAEMVIKYIERGSNFMEMNPFPYTKWDILVRRK
ncbi:MAG: class I SAM-dependent methyltransferase [candidate division Zixibacteria bacterium]|nr:class I SAM-dependent methyltransferase [candidate division Zixibacteria bacterium]